MNIIRKQDQIEEMFMCYYEFVLNSFLMLRQHVMSTLYTMINFADLFADYFRQLKFNPLISNLEPVL